MIPWRPTVMGALISAGAGALAGIIFFILEQLHG